MIVIPFLAYIYQHTKYKDRYINYFTKYLRNNKNINLSKIRKKKWTPTQIYLLDDIFLILDHTLIELECQIGIHNI